MLTLLTFKEKIKQFYSRTGHYMDAVLRFALTIFSLIIINVNIGFSSMFSNPLAIIAISLVCAFLPLNIDLLVILLIILIQLYALAPEIAAAAFLILIVMYFLYFRYTLKDALIVILLPILFFIKIPYVIPLVLGLISTPISVIPVTFGTILYFLLNYVGKNATLLTNVSSDSGITKMTMIFSAVFNDKLFIITFLSFLIIIFLVHFIRSWSIDHAPLIALMAGGVANIIIILIGYLIFDLSQALSVGYMILGSIISIVLAYILQLLLLSADYTRTEYAQFEDDDYYYYVKAVPKINISAPEVNVKRINIQRTKRRNR